MGREKKNKLRREPLRIQCIEQVPGDPGQGVVTAQGFIGWAPNGANADLVANLSCPACGRPIVLAWFVLDELDEDKPVGPPFTFSCADSACYPYRKRHRYAKFE